MFNFDTFLKDLVQHKFMLPLFLTTAAITYGIINKRRLNLIRSKAPPSDKSLELNSCCCLNESSCKSRCSDKINIIVFYGSQSGTAKSLAQTLCSRVKSINERTNIDIFLFECNHFEKVIENPRFKEKIGFIVVVTSTYVGGQPPDNAQKLFGYLKASIKKSDSIIVKYPYAIFGLGNSQYGVDFCKASKEVDSLIQLNGGHSFVESYHFDENQGSELEKVFDDWCATVISRVASDKSHDLDQKNAYESDDEEKFDQDIDDIEDLIPTKQKNDVQTEMVTPIIRKNLTKQGYKIVGTHSAVKMCRWTKSMLRGRGGCYKHTFYGIASHRCMEATPSLACANKCVFCWRHHTNPVGTDWSKWYQDAPDLIVSGFLENHKKMIKEFKGVPGVDPERLKEAMTVKHCALSLVGEPIMYPKINQLLRLLHQHNISSFLVTNAQFPDAIETLDPITQLYVSVDAATEKELKKIDRPLFKDAFQRLLSSLRSLRKVKGRTVYRLTLVKEWNTAEIDAYTALVKEGDPDFIEVKGVTYFGDSKDSKLTMENVPWHEEVLKFSSMLADLLSPRWELMAEHEHSNAVLIAKTSFKVEGDWMTWIDYEKFHRLFNQYIESNGSSTFSALDYAKKTPNWALFGSQERGFDPTEQRFHRKNKT